MLVKCLLTMALCLGITSGQSEAADLAEARSQLLNWQKNIVSIRVRSREYSESDSNVMLREAGVKQTKAEVDWIWEDSGRFRDQLIAYNDGRLVMRAMRFADIKHYYSCGIPAANPASEFPSNVTIFDNSIRHTTSTQWVKPHWILWDNKSHKWLGDRMDNVAAATISADGLLEFDGKAIDVEGFRVSLDPQHCYLPRLVEHPDIGGGVSRYIVDEFREVEPGFWFPWKGTFLLNGNVLNTWEVTQVDLNTELPDTLFVPPMGDETYVVNTLTGKQYWHAGKPPAHLLAAQAAAANPSAPAPNSSPRMGSPESPANWSLWLALLGVVLVSIGVWVRRRA